MFEYLQKINEIGLTFFNNLLNYDFIKISIFYIADLPIFVLPIFLIFFWLYYTKNKNIEGKHNLLFIFYATVLGIIISLIIQQFSGDIQRPELYIDSAKKLIMDNIPDSSFPSDHATVSIAFLTSLFLFGYKKYFNFFISFFIIMLIARIITALHWPLDILAGIFVGVFSAFVIFKSRKNKYIISFNNCIIKIMGFFKL